MSERFNGRVAEVLKTTTFASARHLETTSQKYLHLYNHYIPQIRQTPRGSISLFRRGGVAGRRKHGAKRAGTIV